MPTGLLIPVLVLLLVDRGFSLSQIGAAAAAQGLTVLLLELPTGGLADALGRRPVLLLATVIELAAAALLLAVDSMPVLVLVFVLFGVFRALESGPLDAWYVDAAQAADPDADIGASLAAAGMVTGVAIAAGAMLAGGLVALDPLDDVNPLAVPLLLGLVLRGVDLGLLWLLMRDDGTEHREGSVGESVRAVPQVVGSTLRLIRASRVLTALVAVEFLWGFGMTAFETLLPPRVAETSGDVESAAAILGPVTTAAWIAAGAGAGLVPWLTRRMGAPVAGMTLHAIQAATVVGMAAAGGTAGVVAFFIATMATHGAANAVYQSLLHEQADAAHRTTVLSAASMAAHPGGALGGITLGTLADRASVSTAMVVGACALLAAVPLYLPAAAARRRAEAQPER